MASRANAEPNNVRQVQRTRQEDRAYADFGGTGAGSNDNERDSGTCPGIAGREEKAAPGSRVTPGAAMAESFGSEFTIVEVTGDDFGRRGKQLWIAAAKPDQAITLVLTAVPEGWTAELATGRLTQQQIGALKRLRLEPGEVHEWK